MTESTDLEPEVPMTPVVVSGVARRLGDRRRVSRGTAVNISGLVELIPQIGEMLDGGDELVRIVGSKELISGIRDGSLRYMQGELGHTTTVVNAQSRIVGQVQLQPADAVSSAASAALVFQIGSAITLQYYLQRFDERLTEILSTVTKAREHSAWAQIGRATLEAAEIAAVLQRDGSLAPDLRARLDAEERAVDVVVLQELLPVEEAVQRLATVRAEIAELLATSDASSKVGRTLKAMRETLPHGLRPRLKKALDDLENSMTHWFIAARAAQVHASLRMLRTVDDHLSGRSQTFAAYATIIEREQVQYAIGTKVVELLALPAGTFDLFELDGVVEQRVASLTLAASAMKQESDNAARRLGITVEECVDEMLLAMHDGHVVALSPRKLGA